MHSQHSHAKRCTGFCTNISAPRLLIHGGTLLFQVVVLVQKSDEILRYFIPSEKDECWRRKLKEGGGRRADGDGRCCRYCRSRLSLVDRCGPGTDLSPPDAQFFRALLLCFHRLGTHGRHRKSLKITGKRGRRLLSAASPVAVCQTLYTSPLHRALRLSAHDPHGSSEKFRVLMGSLVHLVPAVR